MNIGGILDKIKSINNENIISVSIPSIQKANTFNPLTIKQQKDLVSTALDGATSILTLSNVINDIILTNSSNADIDFKITDKLPIILELRKQAFGSIYIQDENEFNLDLLLNKKLSFEVNSVDCSIGKDVIVVSLELPSIKKEVEINKYALGLATKEKTDNISTLVGNLFVYEIIKFIKTIKIQGEDVEISKLSISDRYKLVESLPVVLNNDILDYINKIRQQEIDYLTQNEVVLSIDSRFFSK